jgi:antitoxin component of MazEF toxin-antitoxin module
MKQRVMRVGSSIGVTVPADFVKAVGIKVGDMVEVQKFVEKGEVVYKFSGVQQLPITARWFNTNTKRK